MEIKLDVKNYGIDDEYYLEIDFSGIRVKKHKILEKSERHKAYREYESKELKQILEAIWYRFLAIFKENNIFWYSFLIKSLRFREG